MKSTIFFLTTVFMLSLGATSARAEDSSIGNDTQQTQPTPKKKKKKLKKAKAKKDTASSDSQAQTPSNAISANPTVNPDAAPAVQSPQSPQERLSPTPPSLKAEEAAAAETTNARQKTLEGSKSPFSGQFNITYYGSSLNHPFAGTKPNSGNESVAPLVTLTGQVSARYRIDPKTTAGLGTGVTTQTPFQGPKNTSVSNPYADVARSFTLGPIKNRADVQFTLWTDQQYHTAVGQNLGLSLVDEAYYEFSWGLTAGLALEIDFNTFSGAAQYQTADVMASQTTWDIYPEPYFEYALSKTFNLRSVVGVGWDHNRNLSGTFSFVGPRVYQTLGVGIAAFDWLFLYPYVKAYPYSGILGVKTSSIGLNVICNLF